MFIQFFQLFQCVRRDRRRYKGSRSNRDTIVGILISRSEINWLVFVLDRTPRNVQNTSRGLRESWLAGHPWLLLEPCRYDTLFTKLRVSLRPRRKHVVAVLKGQCHEEMHSRRRLALSHFLFSFSYKKMEWRRSRDTPVASSNK